MIHQAIPLTLFALIVAAHESVGGIEITSPSTRWALWGSSGRRGGRADCGGVGDGEGVWLGGLIIKD